jgi:hypothetical protein
VAFVLAVSASRCEDGWTCHDAVWPRLALGIVIGTLGFGQSGILADFAKHFGGVWFLFFFLDRSSVLLIEKLMLEKVINFSDQKTYGFLRITS